MLKKDLRRIFKNKRAQLPSLAGAELSTKNTSMAISLLKTLHFTHVNCFLSSELKGEVNTTPIMDYLFTQKKEISVPVSNYALREITPSLYTATTVLTLDEYSIPTPTSITPVSPQKIDLLIVPLLCFDKNGHRCGYGKGMYDRFLSQCNPEVITVGLSLFDEISEITDLNPTDIPLDYVVTPEKILHFKK